MSKGFGFYLAFAYQFVVSLYFIFSNIWGVYFTSLSLEHKMAVVSPNLLDLTVSVFIPLAVLIGTVLYILNFENKKQIAAKIAFSMIAINVGGVLAFIIQFLNMFKEAGGWAIFAAPLIIVVLPLYVIPTFIWTYLYSKVLPR